MIIHLGDCVGGGKQHGGVNVPLEGDVVAQTPARICHVHGPVDTHLDNNKRAAMVTEGKPFENNPFLP